MTVEVSTDQSRLDVAMIHAFLANESYWVPGISRANVENSVKHSLCFGVYVDGRQAAFARVVTDYVRFAHVLDVFVLKEYRGRGFGKLLVAKMLAHPALSTIIRFTLGPPTPRACTLSSGSPRPQIQNGRWSSSGPMALRHAARQRIESMVKSGRSN